MKNHNDKAMEHYFNSMLSEQPKGDSEIGSTIEDVSPSLTKRPQPLDKLPAVTPVHSEQVVFPEKVDASVSALPQKSFVNEPVKQPDEWKNIEVENEFHVLFFQLSGLTFAVPLIDLGGIHPLDTELNVLIGKPEWFSGVMPRGNALYNIVDTAKWIGTGEDANTLNYSHCVLLGATKWALSCEKLLGTEILTYEQVEWRKVSGKRPWLAGMVKDKMCTLIHAQELIKLLDSGINIHGQ